MSDFLNNVAEKFILRLKEEQCRRDIEVWKGSFVESSVIEHLYRYWFESILVLCGCEEIERETPYSDKIAKNGRKEACDVTASCGNDEYWFELKVAYWNTTYTNSELTSDIKKLCKSPEYARKVYVLIFISSGDEIPEKINKVISENEGKFKSRYLYKEKMQAPLHWTMKNIYCYVSLFELA